MHQSFQTKRRIHRQLNTPGLAAQRGNEIDNFAHSPQLHLGESTTIDGVGTFTLTRVYSGIVWFTPNPGGATFCFTPDPTFTVNPYF